MESGQELRAILERLGFRPSRLRGQNFLLDRNLLGAIVRDAAPAPGATVFEPGCGPGFLTEELLRAGVNVLAVEVDRRLAELVRDRLAGRSGFELIVGDVLAGKHSLSPEVVARLDAGGPFDLVANLPYAIATPLLALLARRALNPPGSMTALVQLEAAQRFAAEPGTKAYGAISVQLQCRYRVELLRRVPPQVFWPQPKVQSALVRLVRCRCPLEPTLEGALDLLLRTGFQHRRKRFLKAVGGLAPGEFWRAAVDELGLDPGARAENVGVEPFVELARRLASRTGTI